ncbi:MAG TPA: serine hydrolase, partial [Negativicutes bacterium]|nr:serine hydrolase [Negativicutes bacterium]
DDAKKFSGTVGIYAKNLKTGKSLVYNGDAVFPAASTAKLVVTMALYKYLYPNASQAKRDWYDQSVDDMIIVSGNDSYSAMLDEIDTLRPDALKRVEKDLGLKKTMTHNEAAFNRYKYHSVTTPYEMACVLENIFRERYLGKKKSAEVKDKLANTIFHDEIPRFMETPVYHKVGALDNLLCDVGIVDDGKDQILISVYTLTEQSEDYASDYIAKTAAKAYNALRRK